MILNTFELVVSAAPLERGGGHQEGNADAVEENHCHREVHGSCELVVWCGVVWCVVWCGGVWCGVVWCCVVLCGGLWCGMV